MKWLLLLLALPAQAAEVAVWFSPGGGCEAAITNEIAKAEKSVLVQAYNFTSPVIGDALAAAARRGVTVVELQDGVAANQKDFQGAKLEQAGGKVLVDKKHRIAHNKIIIVDNKTVLTGSFNFSKNAEKGNAENLVRITGDQPVADQYAQNWSNHLAHCVAWVTKTVAPKAK